MRTRTSIALLLAVAALALPASSLAAPTATNITSPSNPSAITFDAEHPGTLHIAGTTSNGSGDVDIRCYYGNTSKMVDDLIPVTNGSFVLDLQMSPALMNTLGSGPSPYCVLRAVPAGTAPVAPPGQASPWQGPEVGFGQREYLRVGSGNDPTPADTPYDYFRSDAQSAAYNDYDSAGTCGLCDTYLFKPGTFEKSNPIWWANAGIYQRVHGAPSYTRSAAQVDGVDVYTGGSAHMASIEAVAGFPAISYSDHIDPVSGDMTIDEADPFATCGPQPAVYPPTLSSCASFHKIVQLDRHITQSHNGSQVAIVDHWSSLDGQAHHLDVYYDDTVDDANFKLAGHETNLNLTWGLDGFQNYSAGQPLPVADSGPSTLLIKTDGTTPDAGDYVNPIGALTYGDPPEHLVMRQPVDMNNQVADWQAHYDRTIPASGSLTIVQVYSAAFKLADVQSLAKDASTRTLVPAISITTPADSASTEDASIHVAGTASAADGSPTVTVNGVPAPVAGDGSWSADLPVVDGPNAITAVVSNSIGVTATASRTVTRTQPAAPAPQTTPPVPTPASAPRCHVPKLAGRTLRAAKLRLRKAHCRLGKVTHKASGHRRPGRVLATKPGAGRVRPSGTRIRVVIAKRR